MRDAPISEDCTGQVSFLNLFLCGSKYFWKGLNTTDICVCHMTWYHFYHIDQERFRIILICILFIPCSRAKIWDKE